MKVVIAIDSFKGCLTSLEAGNAAKEGVLMSKKDAEVFVLPLADGGEGTVDTLTYNKGEIKKIIVKGPLGHKIESSYGIIRENRTAIIEMATAAGLSLVNSTERNPLITTSYGVGELICDAIKEGCNNFIIGIGGSATNDAGVGMLQALGYRFFDNMGKEIGLGGIQLSKISSIGTNYAIKELEDCTFQIACDVKNPLCGELGASHTFAPQKGATKEMVVALDLALQHFAEKTYEHFNVDYSNIEGTGAAGGLGFAFLAYLKAQLKSGVEIVLDEIKIDKILENADYVITGEGRIDSQTAMGKAPIGVAKHAKAKGVKVIAIAGCISDDAYMCNGKGIDGFFSIVDGAISLEQSMDTETAKKNIVKTVSQIFRLL